MQDFLVSLGGPFVASALRRLAEQLHVGATEWNRESGIAAPVRTASAILLLEVRGSLAITEIAAALRQSHPTVIEAVRELSRLGLVTSEASPVDRRRTLVRLTPEGKQQAERIRLAQPIFESAYRKLCAETGTDLLPGVLKFEAALDRESMADRLREAQAGMVSGKPRLAGQRR